MALSYVGGTTTSWAGSTSGTKTVTLTGLTGGSDAAPSAGDTVIVAYGTGSAADRTLTENSGTYDKQTPELFANGSSFDTNLAVFIKRLTGADTSVVVSPTGSTADAGAVTVHVWRGVDTTTPQDVTLTSTTGTGTPRPNPPSISPTTAGTVVVVIGAGACGTATAFTQSGSELSNFRSVASADNNDAVVGIGSFAWTSGTFDPVAWTGGAGTPAAGDSWAAMCIALRPQQAAALASNATGVVTATGDLTTAIPLAGSAAGVVSAGPSALTTAITLASNVTGQVSAGPAALTTAIALAGGATGVATASASLTFASPLIDTLTENFSGARNSAQWWSEGSTGFSGEFNGGEAELTVNTTDASWSQCYRIGAWSLVGSSVFMRVKPARTVGDVQGWYTQFKLESEQYQGLGNSLLMVVGSGGNFEIWKYDGFSGTMLLQITAASFFSQDHAWWRFRASDTTIYFDTAPSTASNPPVSGDWVNQHSVSRASCAIDLTRLSVYLYSVFYTASGPTQLTTPKFDGLNTDAATATGADLAGDATAVCTTTGDLTTAISLAASATGQVAASADLTTAIPLAGSAVGQVTSGPADLTTAISLSASVSAVAGADGSLTTEIPLAGSASATVTANAALTTSIPLAGSAAAAATAGPAALTTAIVLAGDALADATVSADLTTAITLEGSAAAVATASAEFATDTSLAASATSQVTAAASLDTAINLIASASGAATATGDLTTSIALAGNLQSIANATADLTTAISLAGSASAVAATSSDLTTSISLAGSASAVVATTAALTAGSTHRYWRVYIRAVNGKIDGSTGAKEVEFHETIGGADVTGSGTASADSYYTGGYEPDKAFDNNTGTEWATYVGGVPHWLKYDFGAGNEKNIQELVWTNRNDQGQEPITFDLQWSDDDSAWTTKFSVENYTDAGMGATHTHSAGDSPTKNGAGTFWRVRATSGNGGGVLSMAALVMRETVGGADACTGGTPYASTMYDFGPYYASYAFDNNSTSFWSSNEAIAGSWVGYRFPTAKNIVEIAITDRPSSDANQTPQDFVVEYWDGAAFQTAWTVTGSTGWAVAETRTFDRYTPLAASVTAASSAAGYLSTGVADGLDSAFLAQPLFNGGAGTDLDTASVAQPYFNYSVTGGSAAALAGNLQSVATATGSLTTAITLTASVAGQVTASGDLTTSITLAGSATGVVSAGPAELTTAITLSGSANGVVTADAALTTAIPLDGSASAVVTATGAMAADVALAGDAAAVVSVTGALTTAISLAASASAVVSASGDLTTAIPLAGSSTAQVTVSGALTTAITLAGSAGAVATVTGDLTTAIPLTGSAAAVATVSGSLTTAIPLSGAATAETATTADLTTAITLAGSAASAVEVTGELATAISLAGSASVVVSCYGDFTGSAAALSSTVAAQVTASADLTTAITLAGFASAQVTTSGDLTTAIALSASASVQVTASGDLITPIALAASVAGQVTATGELTTAIALVGSAAGQVTASAALTTAKPLAASVSAQVSTTGALTTAIRFAGSASGVCTAAGSLTTAIRLTGSAQEVVSSSGTLTSTAVHFAGSASGSVSCSADLTTAIAMTGAAIAQAQSSATLTFAIYRALILKAGQIMQVPAGEENMHPAVCAPTAAKPYFHTDPADKPLIVKEGRITTATDNDTVII